jgi:hypothetical protein
MIRVAMKIKNPATRIRSPSDREKPVMVSVKYKILRGNAKRI